MFTQGLPRLSVFDEQVGIFGEKSLTRSPGGDYLIALQMIIPGILIGDVYVLRSYPNRCKQSPHLIPEFIDIVNGQIFADNGNNGYPAKPQA